MNLCFFCRTGAFSISDIYFFYRCQVRRHPQELPRRNSATAAPQTLRLARRVPRFLVSETTAFTGEACAMLSSYRSQCCEKFKNVFAVKHPVPYHSVHIWPVVVQDFFG